MSNTVLKVNEITIKKMKSHYSNQLIEKIPQGGVFVAKLPACTVTAYKSGKVLFQGGDAQSEADKWGTSMENAAPKKAVGGAKKPTHQFAPPVGIGSMSIIGSDEVGTGDYFGPMTVVAAFASEENLALLQELGVKDSKDLTDKQICEIAKSILHVIPYSLLILHNEKYNRLQSSGMTQGKIKALLHNQALGHVLKKIAPLAPDGILIDQFAEPDVYYRHLRGQGEIIRDNVYFSTKAEGVHLSVAAASIIARYSFIKEFDKLSEKCGIELKKGAGPQVDRVAAELIRKLGFEELGQYTKLHFANTGKARRIAGV
ncbi:ribonuclease HIII [Fredinandcohnia quinoae]|uniref:Ribonuclease HIII n=1 Tax=Fredinandcohnia quinoae TaxID=2918902 RepID=A0AAW5E8P0_9BACI|nr:ribonuclease HIII [Fredinandcohnia sp. SECRCQ15]MCH1627319.1 ribonuclease HIII [Fredinandcohnia sp. SECRCQ15]